MEEDIVEMNESDESERLNKRLDELKSGLSEESRKYREAVMKNLLVKHKIAADKLSYLNKLIDSDGLETEGFEEKADELIKTIITDLPSLLKTVEEIGINPAVSSKEKTAEDFRTIVSKKLKKSMKRR